MKLNTETHKIPTAAEGMAFRVLLVLYRDSLFSRSLASFGGWAWDWDRETTLIFDLSGLEFAV